MEERVLLFRILLYRQLLHIKYITFFEHFEHFESNFDRASESARLELEIFDRAMAPARLDSSNKDFLFDSSRVELRACSIEEPSLGLEISLGHLVFMYQFSS